MVHEVELSSIPTLDISVGVTVNGQNLHPLVSKMKVLDYIFKTVTKDWNTWQMKFLTVFVSLNLNKVNQKKSYSKFLAPLIPM